jgi:hypothetical protein
MTTGWSIVSAFVAAFMGLLFWWMWYNGLTTGPRVGRHARAGAGAARAASVLPRWLRGWLLRVLVILGILVLMAIVDWLSRLLFGFGLGDVWDWLDDYFGRAGGKTLTKTLWQPLPIYIAIVVAVIVAIMYGYKKLAALIVIATLGLTIFFYFVPTKCWSKDAACIAAQQKAENEATMRELQEKLRAQQRAAAPSVGIIPNLAATAHSALWGTTTPSPKCEVPKKTHEFTLEREQLNPDPTKCGCGYGSLDKGTFYVWVIGKTADNDKIEVRYNSLRRGYSFPNDVALIAAKDAPFNGAYECGNNN